MASSYSIVLQIRPLLQHGLALLYQWFLLLREFADLVFFVVRFIQWTTFLNLLFICLGRRSIFNKSLPKLPGVPQAWKIMWSVYPQYPNDHHVAYTMVHDTKPVGKVRVKIHGLERHWLVWLSVHVIYSAFNRLLGLACLVRTTSLRDRRVAHPPKELRELLLMDIIVAKCQIFPWKLRHHYEPYHLPKHAPGVVPCEPSFCDGLVPEFLPQHSSKHLLSHA